MELPVKQIEEFISKIPFVKSLYSFEQRDLAIYGKFKIDIEELEDALDFDVIFYPHYPLKAFNSESIKFINTDLIEYDHVMGDGSICIHTTHSTKIEEKLLIDFHSLKNWILKYYLKKDKDTNYEHIIINEKLLNDNYHAYIFTETNHKFVKGEFGEVKLSFLNSGIYKGKPISNYIVQSFVSESKHNALCEWSSLYRNYEAKHSGYYIFIENAPAHLKRFAFNNWLDLIEYLPQGFLVFLHNFEKNNKKRFTGMLLPIFVGYNTVGGGIHWQVAMIELGKFPIKGIPELKNGIKTGKWNTVLVDDTISWMISRDSSRKYFFGRGALSENIIDKKILIIGVGAIGSIIAKTLTKGGCRNIDIVDYDIKEPENVCRSEYLFNTGIIDKTEELIRILHANSPFVEVAQLKNDYFENLIKVLYKEEAAKEKLIADLSNYDIIFDCTTDNDLMHVLDTLNLKNDLINMSITNHARDLVCAFHPNIYHFVNNQFSNVLDNDVEDVYNPTGCWNPTFKASYNDINALVQLALRNVNVIYENGMAKNNFIIKSDDKDKFTLKTVEY